MTAEPSGDWIAWARKTSIAHFYLYGEDVVLCRNAGRLDLDPLVPKSHCVTCLRIIATGILVRPREMPVKSAAVQLTALADPARVNSEIVRLVKPGSCPVPRGGFRMGRSA